MKTKKLNDEDYTANISQDIEQYKLILSGVKERFPKGFWQKAWSRDSAKEITKYILKVKLDGDVTRLKTVNKVEFFKEVKLNGMISAVYNFSYWDAIQDAICEDKNIVLYPWDVGFTPKGYWLNKDNVKRVLLYIIETKAPKDFNILLDFNASFLRKYNLTSLLVYYSIYDLIDIINPNTYLPWDASKVPREFWDEVDNVKRAMCWLVEEKLPKDFNVNLDFSIELLRIAGFGALLNFYKVQDLLNIAYPGKYISKNLTRRYSTFKELRDVCIILYKTKYKSNKAKLVAEISKDKVKQFGLRKINPRTDLEIKAIAETVDW